MSWDSYYDYGYTKYDPYWVREPAKPSLATRVANRISALEKELDPLYMRLGKLVAGNGGVANGTAAQNVNREIEAKLTLIRELKNL